MRQPSHDRDPAVADHAVDRPAPDPRPSDRAREWIDWFGVTRLVTSAIAVIVVCVGAWWLVRTPTPPPESALPTAVSGQTAPSATLPPPDASGIAPTTSEFAAGPATVVVHVAGAVTSPGVYLLGSGDRVADAVAAAGGATAEADAGSVNLAAPLIDGSRIYLPEVGETVPLPVTQAGPAAAADDPEPGPVDVNTADAPTLEQLPGVGPATAAAIVSERDRNGPFASFDDLERVPGIGPAKLAALEGLVVT